LETCILGCSNNNSKNKWGKSLKESFLNIFTVFLKLDMKLMGFQDLLQVRAYVGGRAVITLFARLKRKLSGSLD
jgi:hypothetical protein